MVDCASRGRVGRSSSRGRTLRATRNSARMDIRVSMSMGIVFAET